jgi:outer membrane lipoprotein-sorting protein
MAYLRLFICCCCFLTSTVFAHAADLPSILAEARSRAVSAQSSIRDMVLAQESRITGIRDTGEQRTAQTKIFKKGTRFRMETTVQPIPGGQGNPSSGQARKTVVIFDGENTWVYTPVFGRSRLPRGETAEYQVQQNWWDNVSPQARLNGTEDVRGRTCYVIDNTADPNALFKKLWVDTSSYQLVQTAFTDKNNQPLIMVFSDFRPVTSGLEMPYRTETIQDGRPLVTSTVMSVALNQNLPDDLFDEKTLTPANPSLR